MIAFFNHKKQPVVLSRSGSIRSENFATSAIRTFSDKTANIANSENKPLQNRIVIVDVCDDCRFRLITKLVEQLGGVS